MCLVLSVWFHLLLNSFFYQTTGKEAPSMPRGFCFHPGIMTEVDMGEQRLSSVMLQHCTFIFIHLYVFIYLFACYA